MGLDALHLDPLDRLDIPQRLGKIASLYGDKVAVRSKSDSLTFHQLNENASLVAQSLLESLPSDRQYPVAVLLDGSTAIISTIYGTLRAGHFYCAISTAERLEHIARVLNDLGKAVVITENDVLGRVQQIIPAECRVLIYRQLHGNRLRGNWPALDSKALAGIFYTSGSTGVPKGVLRTHLDMQYLTRNFGRHLGFCINDRILAMRPFGSTSSAVDVFGGLLNSASLVTYDLKAGRVADLVAVLKSEKITIFRPPVQVMRSLIDLLPKGEYFRDIRLFFATGDVFYRKDVERIRKIISRDAIIVHQLASSEAGLLAVNKIAHNTPLDDGIVPVGHPLPEQEVLILDEQGGIITDHQFGEIGVRGDFLFPGYWRHPEWTADMFIPDPRDPQKKIMRTGDLGRFRPDGQLELNGRKDSRVKIRGFSVDLSAIEIILMSSPDVQRAIVVVAVDPVGQKHLVAYILPVTGTQPAPKDLLNLISVNLPSYMVPALMMIVPEIPIGLTGKADRKALPAPRWERPTLSAPFMTPGDAVEEKLVAIWKKTLRIQQVGINDNFFELGGDSLMAMHLLMAIEDAFSRKVPFAIISKASNIKQQAEILRKDRLVDYASVLIPVQPNGDKKPIYCIGGRGGLPIRFYHLLKYMRTNQPVYFFRSHGFGPGEQLKYAKEDIAADYLREIKKIQPQGPYNLLGESGGGLVAYEIAQQLHAHGDEVGFLGMLDTKIGKIEPPKNFKPDTIMVVKKHLQTLRSGSFSGFQAYIKYYIELLKFQLYQVQIWIKERQSHRHYGGLPGVFNRVSEANATASRVYKIKPYPGTVVTFNALRQSKFDGHGLDNGWGDVGVGKLIVHPLDCYHGNILFEPFVQQVAEKVNQHLDESSKDLP